MAIRSGSITQLSFSGEAVTLLPLVTSWPSRPPNPSSWISESSSVSTACPAGWVVPAWYTCAWTRGWSTSGQSVATWVGWALPGDGSYGRKVRATPSGCDPGPPVVASTSSS